MKPIDSVAVYCGASTRVDKKFNDAAYELGQVLAKKGIRLVYGGGRLGLMGSVADGALSQAGEVIGFMPGHLQDLEQGHKGLTEFHLVEDMHSRKRCMFENACAFIVMPGGFGSLDEMFEIVTWRQIGLHDKPLIVLNLFGYWDSLKALVNNVFDMKFAREHQRDYFTFVDKIEDVVPLLEQFPNATITPRPEWI